MMNNTLKLQLDVKNNAEELRNYMLDLNNWEDEMKRKELAVSNEDPTEKDIPPPRNKIKRSNVAGEKNSDKPKKISAYDYSAWDKFDVEKACAEIDEDDHGEKTSEEQINETAEMSSSSEKDDDNDCGSKNFSLVDEAFYEKEMGNNFVKKEQWADALKCYTNAINLDSNNAIYYANRSLCFLKLKNFKAAETDATTAIQLDKKYVKAFQRRAFARKALGQLLEAKSDYEEILKLEPKNTLCTLEINKIDEVLKKELGKCKPSEKKTFNHKNMFKSEESKVQTEQPIKTPKQQQPAHKKIFTCKSETVINKQSGISDSNCKTEDTFGGRKGVMLPNETYAIKKGGDGDKVVKTQSKPREGIFKPLPEWCEIVYPVNLPPHKRSQKPLKQINITLVDKDEDFTLMEEARSEHMEVPVKMEEKVVISKPVVDEEVRNEQLSFDVPKTAIQFQKSWKVLKKNPKEAYNYLKKIPGNELPQIFENSLESDFFSDLVTFLAGDKVEKEPDFIYNFLLGLSSVKRFSSLTLFMSEADRGCIKKCLMVLEKARAQEEISQLQRLYELKK